jgi:hypothetical protein
MTAPALFFDEAYPTRVGPAGHDLLARGYMLLGPGGMLFEHFAHPASLHGSGGDGERRRREREH